MVKVKLTDAALTTGARRGVAGTLAAGLLALCLSAPAGYAAEREETPGPSLPASAFPHPAFSSRLLIVHFWATWCIPCKKEIPDLVRFYQGPFARLHGQNVTLATVSNDLRGSDLVRYLASQEFPLPLYFDPYSRISAEYDVSALPVTLVVGQDGTVLKRWLGSVEWNEPALAAELETLIGQTEIAP